MDYYFQDELRWSFGFENPNKAAALIAAALPLLWIFVPVAWNLRHRVARGVAVWLASGALWAGWWLLFKTYSRGGILAAAAGFLYIGWRVGLRQSRLRLAMMVAGVVIVAALFIGTNAAERSTQWMGQREGSVENRFELWRGGVQMVAAIPQGVGRGNSGAVYMQWFQPLESTTRYRTLVNSYLTFVAEQGVWIFGIVLLAGVLFWRGTHRVPAGPLSVARVAGCRGAILAFAVAGFFTTTMEDWRVWIPPALAAAFLAWEACRADSARVETRRRGWVRPAGEALAASMGICGALVVSGWVFARQAPVQIASRGGGMQIAPTADRQARRYWVMVDEPVLGEDYGKLLRRLALDLHSAIEVQSGEAWSPEAVPEGETLVATGEAAACLPPQRGRDLVLIAPARMEAEAAERLLREAGSVLLLNPSFDEDGRVSFWKERAGGADARRVHQRELAGVGTEVVWAWEQIGNAMAGKEPQAQ